MLAVAYVGDHLRWRPSTLATAYVGDHLRWQPPTFGDDPDLTHDIGRSCQPSPKR